ncbi:MAG: TIGR02391 family protein [Chitinophagaceae bacterium]|nr:TIGR02391 family protein [Chitinophagaceae bacterium]
MATPIIELHFLESICRCIAETNLGLTGQEIGKILADSNIPDTDPSTTKWKRLYNAFINWQNEFQRSDHILNFLKNAMQPARYIQNPQLFESRRNELNKCLSFIGTEISDKGTLRRVDKSTTITEAQQRASIFKYKLENRNVHPTVMNYCNAELLVENYFHSVFEAIKSIADRIRETTGLYADGQALVDTAFSLNSPLIRINLLQTDTHRSEHLGLANIIKGLFGLIRNPTAHIPKIKFQIQEDEALDIMTSVSMVHKILDRAR